MRIPWRMKSFAYKVLAKLPGGALYFVQRYVTRRAKVSIPEIYVGWKHHADVLGNRNAKTLIEFGAGKTLAQNLYLSTLGIQQTVVDLFPMLEFDLVNEAISQLKALGVPLSGKKVSSTSDLESHYGIRYIAPFDMRDSGFEDDSFDCCVSTNTLEHIPPADIAAILKELKRVVRPNGVLSAMIDYSDHYAHTDPKIDRLNYLQFTEQQWQKYNVSNHFQNRLRHKNHEKLFREAGFAIVKADATDYCTTKPKNVVESTLTGDETDFATTGFWVLSSQRIIA